MTDRTDGNRASPREKPGFYVEDAQKYFHFFVYLPFFYTYFPICSIDETVTNPL